jgi:hypothetical protein
MSESGDRVPHADWFAGYLLVQAVVGVVLWIAWGTSSTVRSWFELRTDDPAVMDAFVFADLAIGVVGSAAGAWGLHVRARWVLPVIAFTAGGLVYATLYLVGWVSFTGTGAVALAIMVPPATASAWITYRIWRALNPRATLWTSP